MSIASRMEQYELKRSTTKDAYGIIGTPAKIADIEVAISRNQPTHDTTNPVYSTTEYVGITQFVGVVEGDIIEGGAAKYLVKDVGDRLTLNQAIFLEKL